MPLAAESAGSAGRIAAAVFVLVPPCAAAGEVTEKGTINGRFLQRNRPDLMELLFGDDPSDMVIRTSREH
jgi:hypothetical protein